MFCPGGGLSAVIWTDFVQTILMIIGALWLMILSFKEVGGYEELIEKYRSVRSSENNCQLTFTPRKSTAELNTLIMPSSCIWSIS